jgi:hypothetical protein
LEEPGADKRIILKRILKKIIQENVDLFGVVGDREKWQSLVKMVLQYLLI